MPSKDLSKAVTARFPAHDYFSLLQEAERRGCTIADVIRDAWFQCQQLNHIQQQLLQLENRLIKANFDIFCTVIGLQEDEREQALKNLQKIGVRW